VLRPGIATECEQIALEARAEIGLRAEDQLNPEELAAHLAIELRPLHSFSGKLPASVYHLTVDARSVFSAVTVYRNNKRIVVYNSAHSPRRHVNTIAHELAHVLLDHAPTRLFDEYGQRVWIAGDEAEADYLAGALLVPLPAVAPVMDRVGDDLVDAAEHFGVSESLMQYRVVVAGGPVRVEMAEFGQLFGGEVESPAELAAGQSRRIRRPPVDSEVESLDPSRSVEE